MLRKGDVLLRLVDVQKLGVHLSFYLVVCFVGLWGFVVFVPGRAFGASVISVVNAGCGPPSESTP
jgi:hypothetical protein